MATTELAVSINRLRHIPLKQLHPHPNNRKYFRQASIDELAESLKHSGQTTPIIVRPHAGSFQLLAGERRWRAATQAKLDHLLAIVRDYDDAEAIKVLAIENKHREDPDPLDEADLYHAMLKFEGESITSLAKTMEKSESYIRDRLRLTHLTAASRKLLRDETISLQHAILLAGLKPADQQRAIGSQSDRDNVGSYQVSGLFRTERTLFDDERDTRVPVSVAEFRDWIRTQVRLDPKAPVTGELFPEAVQLVHQAEAAKQKVLSITSDYRVSDAAKDGDVRTIGAPHWKRADGKRGSKTCEYSEPAFVVSGELQGQGFAVCIRKDKCTTHWPHEAAEAKRRLAAKAKAAKKAAAASEDPKAEATAKAKEQREQEKAKAAEAARDAELARWKKAEPALRKVFLAALVREPVTADSRLGRLVLQRAVFNDRETKKFLTPGKRAEDVLRYLALDCLFEEMGCPIYNGPENYGGLLKFLGVDARKILDQEAPAAPKAKAKAKGKAA